jgi:hypothetical protein
MKQLRKINSKYFVIATVISAIFCFITPDGLSQRPRTGNLTRALTSTDTIPKKRIDSTRLSITSSDTAVIPGDSSRFQKTDTFSLKLSKDTLDAPVKYEAEDSAVVMVKGKTIVLYGKTKTEYKDIKLTAPRVYLDQETQVLTAYNKRDSAGNVLEDARFSQGESSFTSDTIRYNFKSQKGQTKNTITSEGGGYVHAETAKRMGTDVTYVKGGLFTTCNLDEPHFAFRANRIKIINQKLAISGPARPEFEGVPIPIWLPFGIFPLSQNRHSGFLPPQFATNEQFGLGLEGVGYYKVINDYWDAKVYGNIYSYGGWSFNVNPTYRRLYRYRGSFNFGLQTTKMNFKGDPDYLKNKSYTLNWSHSTDSKARPGVTFSANVNASSTKFNRYVPNSPMLNYQNLLASSISYSKTTSAYSLTVSANHSQNNQTRLVNLSLPDIGFSVPTIYPFQNKEKASRKWYDQVGIGYNGTLRNQVAFYDSLFSFRRILDTLQWGAQHNFPITLSLPPMAGGAIMVSPSVSYGQVWISRKFVRTWDDAKKKVDTTITKGFFIDHQASFGLGLSTALYGKFEFKHSRVMAIRHVIRPTIGINYQPDLSSKHFYTVQVDTSGYKQRFSEFEGALYPGFGGGKFGGLSFQLDNNLEMKLRPKKPKDGSATEDTTGQTPVEPKKVHLVDGYGLTFSYNFFADSFRLSPVSLYFRTNLFEKININATANLDPYQADSHGRDIAKYAWSDGKFNLGRITSGSISISTSFQSKPKDDQKAKQKEQQIKDLRNDPSLIGDQQRLLDYMRQNPSEFVDFNIPWSISISYSLYFSKQIKSDYSGYENKFTSSLPINGSFNLTPKWNFSVNGYYDLDTKKLQTFQMSISREMHCWQMSISVNPKGPYKFFSFSISPKSGLLQDLRINRTRSFYTGY